MKSRINRTICIFFLGIFTFNGLIGWMNKSTLVSDEAIRGSLVKSIPILQMSGNNFIVKKHCATCHHSVLTAMVVDLAKQKGVPVEDSFANRRIKSAVGNLHFAGDPNDVQNFLNIKLAEPYVLLGLAADGYPPDVNTDLAVAFIMCEANLDGSFPGEFSRAPLEDGQIHVTAISIRAIQLYAAPALKPQVDQLLAKTKYWLENVKTDNQQELIFQLLGLQWCGSSDALKKDVAAKIMKLQHADGGWSQLPSLNSDAYATGETLYALYVGGMIQTEDNNCQRALRYLLNTQEPDGSWFVQARSFIIQPFINSGFPPGDENQFISAAATNWSSLALLKSLPDKKISSTALTAN